MDAKVTAAGASAPEDSAPPERRALVVLGMHRSGTSALARVLSLLGATLPEHLLGASKGNETGHWEPERLVTLHDKMLAEAGSRWDDWRAFDPAVIGAERRAHYRQQIKALLAEEYADAPLIVLKDPRICRFVPLHDDILREMGIAPLYVLSGRNPLAVMASLGARNAMTPGFASLLWLRHVLDAEAATRERSRILLSYDALLDDWRAAAAGMSTALGLEWPRAADEAAADIEVHLSRDLRHHAPDRTALEADAKIPAWIKQAYDALRHLEADPANEAAIARLDTISEEFGTYADLFGEAVGGGSVRQDELANAYVRMRDSQRAHVNGLKGEVVSVREKLQTEADERAAVQEALERREAELDRAQMARAKADRQAKALERRLKKMDAHAASLEDALAGANAAAAAARDALETEARERAAVQEALERREAEIQQVSADKEMEKGQLIDAYNSALVIYREEKYTVLRPIYRNVYRYAARAFRASLPERIVDRIRSHVPNPDGLPPELTYSARDTKIARIEVDEVSSPTGHSDIFIFSIIDWDFRYQRPQHIAKFLSGRHRVFYVEMMLSLEGLSVRRVEDNLYCVRLPMAEIGHIQPYVGQPAQSQIRNWVSAVYNLCDAVKATAFKQVIIQHPYWWPMARHLPPEFQLVFDCMDDIAGFSNTEPFLLEQEKDMLANCDKLVVSSKYLFEKNKQFRTPVIIRNGGEIEHFTETGDDPLPAFLSSSDFSRTTGKIRIGYVGAIAEWFDSDLIASAAQAASDFEFHLCGSVTSIEAAQLDTLDNVSMHGEIPYAEVPAFLRQMDVLIIPFKLVPIIQACDPVKFYEYSSMGKPTVSTRLPELARAEHFVFFASTPQEFVNQVHTAHQKGKDEAFRQSLREYAANNTWGHRGELFENVLSDLPRVSVVILAYGEAHWTKATLHSLFDGGVHYPNMEVIVVDNGSTPDALSEIHETAQSYPDVTVIENGQNLGFARGNNAGMTAATGDYVMLLNNDTYLAPGAIFAMMRHLQRKPNAGAVGPLTNNIGNEAKLFVEYANMDEMKRVARKATTGYRGLSTPLDVLAYFAVMFRKRDLDLFGGLCEDYGRGMFEDDDHCRVIRSNGYFCALAEDAFVHHHLSGTFDSLGTEEKKVLFEKNKKIFEEKWGEWKSHIYRLDRKM